MSLLINLTGGRSEMSNITMRRITPRQKLSGLGAAVVLVTSASMFSTSPAAQAVPNDCNAPTFYRSSAPIANDGTLYQTCSAGTQVTYTMDCFISDVTYTHYFATSGSMSKFVACDYSKGPIIGLLSYEFS